MGIHDDYLKKKKKEKQKKYGFQDNSSKDKKCI